MSSKTKTAEAGKKNWLLIVIAAVLAILLIGGVAFGILENSGSIQRGRTAMKTENYKVTNTMMTYYFRTQYNNFVNQYGQYLSYFGLDTNKSLKTQYYDTAKTTTWFDYFMDSAKSQAEETLLLCEQAKKNGLSLDDEDKKEINEAIDSLKTYAKLYNLSANEYVAAMYGTGVKVKDVRACLELAQLASKQADKMEDSYSFDEAARSAYAEEHKSDFYSAEFLTYTFSAEYETDADDTAKTAAKEVAKGLADALAEKTTEETFYQAIHDKKVADAAAEAEEGEEPKNVEDTADDYRSTKAFGEESDLEKWLFADDRKVGDTTVIEDGEDYDVYLVTKTAAKEDYLTVNVRHVLFGTDAYENKDAAKAKAEEVMASFKAGTVNEDEFAKLVKEYSTDTGSVENGGLYENVYKGQMVDSFNDWCFDEARKVGDVDLVESDYGWHLMYFVGNGEAKWSLDADNVLKSDAYQKDLESYKTAFPITVDNENIHKIDA